MSRIFPVETIESGGVPTTEDFDTAKEMFARSALRLVESDAITGGLIFGSVAAGRQGVRSDVDLLIAVNGGQEDHWAATREMIDEVHDETGHRLVISSDVYDSTLLTRGMSGMDRLFGHHLLSDDKIIFGADPAEYLCFPDRPILDIITSYLAHKSRRLSSAYIQNDSPEKQDGGVQRMLELPIAVGRKVVQALAEVNGEDSDVQGADKPSIIKASETFFASVELDDGFQVFRSLNREYDCILRDTIKGVTSLTAYTRFLGGINKHLPRAIDWVNDVHTVVKEIIEAKTRQ